MQRLSVWRKPATKGESPCQVGQPSGFLATIQVGVTFPVCSLQQCADTFAEYIVAAFGTGINLGLVHGISLWLSPLCCLFTPHFRRTCSKAIGNEQCRKHCLLLRGRCVSFICLSGHSSRCFGNDQRCAAAVRCQSGAKKRTGNRRRNSYDDWMGSENGSIEQADREMINNIFEFDDRTAEGRF